MGAAFAHNIASACDVESASVVDVNGKNATVTVSPGGLVTSFVLEISGLSANDIAARLYSSSFREVLGNSTAAIVGKASIAQVTSMSLEPKRFALPTTTTTVTTTGTVTVTVTSTATAASTVAVTSAGATTTARHYDIASTIMSTTTSSDTSALGAKRFLLVLLLAMVMF